MILFRKFVPQNYSFFLNQALFIPLNLPPRPLRLSRNASGQTTVFDPLRGKWLVLTPEEWVRQHTVAHLVGDLGYPAALTANEVSLRLNGRLRRCDTLVWRAGAAEPLMVVEYKAPHVTITQETFDQIARYNMVMHARCLMVTNGLTHYCCLTEEASTRFIDHIPSYSELLGR